MKHIRGYSPSLISREMQIVTTMKDHLAPVRVAIIKNNNCQGGRGEKEPS